MNVALNLSVAAVAIVLEVTSLRGAAVAASGFAAALWICPMLAVGIINAGVLSRDHRTAVGVFIANIAAFLAIMLVALGVQGGGSRTVGIVYGLAGATMLIAAVIFWIVISCLRQRPAALGSPEADPAV